MYRQWVDLCISRKIICVHVHKDISMYTGQSMYYICTNEINSIFRGLGQTYVSLLDILAHGGIKSSIYQLSWQNPGGIYIFSFLFFFLRETIVKLYNFILEQKKLL